MDSTPASRRRAARRAVGACLAVALGSCLALVAFATAQSGPGGVEQAITITVGPGTASVTGAESLQAGPARVTMRATGRQQSGGLLARLRPGATFEQLERFASRSEAVPVNLISLEAFQFLAPGQTVTTTIVLKPGEYVAAGDGGNQRGLGKVARFTVGSGTAPGTLPAGDASIRMYDYGFLIPKRIDGDGVLRIDNIGRNEHFIVGIRLNPGVDPRVVRRQLISGNLPQGPPPGEFVSIIGVVSPGTKNALEVDLKPGVYLVACFFSDSASAGHEHSEFGMVRQMTVR